MLSKKLLETLARAIDVRVETGRNERRGGVRLPFRGQTVAHRIENGIIGELTPLRTRDISVSGMSVMSILRQPLSHEFVLRLEATGYGQLWIWMVMRRRTEYDRTCSVTSALFLRILARGQTLVVGKPAICFNWCDIEGEALADEQLLLAG